MTLISARTKNLEESPFVTFSSLASRCKDAIRLNSGSPGHGLAPEVYRAICQVDSKELSTYRTHPYGSPEARKDASKYFKLRYGIEFDPSSQINVTTGFTRNSY
jgi:aspartate/methionine/tyrosine aminotransferase